MAIQRKGKPCNLTFEHEALEILHRLCPSGKSYGLFLSHLIRQEEQRRLEARRLRQQLVPLVDEVVQV